MTITSTQLQMAAALAGAASLALPPNAQAIVGAALAALNTVNTWQSTSATDVTDEELAALFAQFEKNKADDLAAQAAAGGGT